MFCQGGAAAMHQMQVPLRVRRVLHCHPAGSQDKANAALQPYFVRCNFTPDGWAGVCKHVSQVTFSLDMVIASAFLLTVPSDSLR